MRVLFLLILTVAFPIAALGQVMVGDEFQVNSYTTGRQWDVSVSHSSDGSFVVIWESDSQDGSLYAVEGQRYDSTGAPEGIEFQVNSYTTDKQKDPSISHSVDGSFVVVWGSSTQDGNLSAIEGQRYDSTGAPEGVEFQVNSYTTSSQSTPSVSHGNDGSFVVVWQSYLQDDDSFGIEGQRYDSTGTPTGGEFQINSYTTNSQTSPEVSHGAGDSFVVVWDSLDQDGSSSAVEGQRYDSTGVPVGGEFQVNSYTTGSQKFPGINHAADGSFVVVWWGHDQDGSSYSVEGQRYDSTGALVGGEFQVNTHTTDAQRGSGVSHAADGSFVVVWQSYLQDGSFAAIEGQRYDSTGAPLGGEFQINSYTTGHQLKPRISHGSGGSFVVIWGSRDQDGSDYAVEGQRFCSGNSVACIPVFADGFESGDTSLWSSTQP